LVGRAGRPASKRGAGPLSVGGEAGWWPAG